MRKILSQNFFDRPTLLVGQELLGKFIVRRSNIFSVKNGSRKAIQTSLMITEVEAYDGPSDLASHARRGITPRTKVMFGRAGYFYVYFTYGIHWMVNIVTGPLGYPAAILIRAGTYIDPVTKKEIAVSGPARFTKFLGIDKRFNETLASQKSNLWFEDHGVIVTKEQILATKRIGIDYAGHIWKNKKYNFKLNAHSQK